MKPEKQFLDALRSVTIHLIKHDQPLHKQLVGIVEHHDKHTWTKLEQSEKLAHLTTVQELVPDLEVYYEKYPHGWSRERYEEMKAALEPCREAISAEE